MFYDPHAPLPRTASYASHPPRTASYASHPPRTASYGAPSYTSDHAYEPCAYDGPQYTSGYAYEPRAYDGPQDTSAYAHAAPRSYEAACAYEPRMPRTASHVPDTRSYADRYLATTSAFAASEQQRVMGTSARSFYESQLA